MRGREKELNVREMNKRYTEEKLSACRKFVLDASNVTPFVCPRDF